MDEDGAWLIELDGTPAATGSITMTGTLTNPRHRRIEVNGQTFETVGDPSWLDAAEIDDIHEGLQRRTRTHFL